MAAVGRAVRTSAIGYQAGLRSSEIVTIAPAALAKTKLTDSQNDGVMDGREMARSRAVTYPHY